MAQRSLNPFFVRAHVRTDAFKTFLAKYDVSIPSSSGRTFGPARFWPSTDAPRSQSLLRQGARSDSANVRQILRLVPRLNPFFVRAHVRTAMYGGTLFWVTSQSLLRQGARSDFFAENP